MKKILLTGLFMACLAIIFASCEKDNPAVNSDLVSVSFGVKNGATFHFGREYTPSFDGKGRLLKVEWKGYSDHINPNGPANTGEDIWSYNDSKHTATITQKAKSLNEETKKWETLPTKTYSVTFDGDGKVTATDYEGSDLVFTYSGDYLESVKNSEYDNGDRATWKDGDLVRYDYSGGSHYEITYGTDENTLGIDFTLEFIGTDFYYFGLAGKHSAHLPVSIKQVFSADSFINYKFFYEKDAKGRITKVSCPMLDDNGQPESSHVRVTEYKYK